MGSWGKIRSVGPAAAAALLLCALFAPAIVPVAGADPVRVLEFGSGDLSSLRGQARDIRSQIDQLDRRAQIAVEKYDAARADLDAATARLIEMRRELDVAQARLDLARTVLGERLAAMYKSEDLSLLDVLVNARDFADVGTQLDYVRLVNEADRSALHDVVTLTRTVTSLTRDLERERAAALDKESEMQSLRADVEDQLAERRALLDGVNKRIGKLLAQQRAAARAAADRLAGNVDLDSITGSDAQLATVRETMRWLGVPYVWAGASPRGFDCSGLVMYVFAKFGVRLPHAATYQARLGTPVPFDQLQPADLVFFGSPSFYHHVGIYVGNGSFIEAPHTGDVVKVSPLAGRGATLACRYPLQAP